jgi:ApaG protein
MYSKQTNGLVVNVTPEFLEEHSRPDEGRFVWAYRITIVNKGSQRVQLLNRYWKIIDAQGRTQEVRGAGVVGEQPVLDPGQEFSYTSGCPLETSSGVMMGSYEMVAEDGSHFDISIPAFSLDSPLANMAVN